LPLQSTFYNQNLGQITIYKITKPPPFYCDKPPG
jgi:hypothetical protein